jgi:hypothetical protein
MCHYSSAYVTAAIMPSFGGHAVAQLVEALHCKVEGCGFDPSWSQWTGVDSASNRIEYQEYLLGGGGGKGGRCVGLTHRLHVPIV